MRRATSLPVWKATLWTPLGGILWAAPALLLLGGAAVAALVIRRRVRTARADPAALEEEPDNL